MASGATDGGLGNKNLSSALVFGLSIFRNDLVAILRRAASVLAKELDHTLKRKVEGKKNEKRKWKTHRSTCYAHLPKDRSVEDEHTPRLVARQGTPARVYRRGICNTSFSHQQWRVCRGSDPDSCDLLATSSKTNHLRTYAFHKLGTDTDRLSENNSQTFDLVARARKIMRQPAQPSHILSQCRSVVEAKSNVT